MPLVSRFLGFVCLFAALNVSAAPLDDYLAQLARCGRDATVVTSSYRSKSADKPYYVASITKTVTAAAVVTLSRSGKLALTDPITKFFSDVPQDKKAITVEQLLRHTSGIDHLYSADAEKTRDEAVRAVLATELVSAPGAEDNYSSDGYVLLAAIVEVASGETYDRYVARTLLRPAGMRRSAFVGACPRDIARAVGKPCELPAILARRGPSGLVTTANDLIRWVNFAVKNNLHEIGWQRVGTMVGHGGDDDVIGHSSIMFQDTANGRTVAVLSNTGVFRGQSMAWVVTRYVLAGAPPLRTVALPDAPVETQEAVDILNGGPVQGAAERNALTARWLAGEVELRTFKPPAGARILGTGPNWWSPDGGTSTWLRAGETTYRIHWDGSGNPRGFGKTSLATPLEVLPCGFDPVSAALVSR